MRVVSVPSTEEEETLRNASFVDPLIRDLLYDLIVHRKRTNQIGPGRVNRHGSIEPRERATISNLMGLHC
jgi:hypothetical protein